MESKFIAKVRLTKQGQVTLPQEARKDLNIELGSELYWYEINNSLVLVKDLVNQKEIIDVISKKKR
jgi:AbrB family looped-hinge helix DNA binding protein